MTLANPVANLCQPANVVGRLNLKEPQVGRLAGWHPKGCKGLPICPPSTLAASCQGPGVSSSWSTGPSSRRLRQQYVKRAADIRRDLRAGPERNEAPCHDVHSSPAPSPAAQSSSKAGAAPITVGSGSTTATIREEAPRHRATGSGGGGREPGSSPLIRCASRAGARAGSWPRPSSTTRCRTGATPPCSGTRATGSRCASSAMTRRPRGRAGGGGGRYFQASSALGSGGAPSRVRCQIRPGGYPK